MEYHENKVYLTVSKDGSSLEGGSYEIYAHNVTSGQDPDHNIKNGTVLKIESSKELDFVLGRKGSDDVAEWFAKEFTSSQNTFNKEPDELNFGTRGTLLLTLTDGKEYKFKDVGFAQGNTLGSNNWWFASQSGDYIGQNRIRIEGTDSDGNTIYAVCQRGEPDNGDDQVTINIE